MFFTFLLDILHIRCLSMLVLVQLTLNFICTLVTLVCITSFYNFVSFKMVSPTENLFILLSWTLSGFFLACTAVYCLVDMQNDAVYTNNGDECRKRETVVFPSQEASKTRRFQPYANGSVL